MQSCYVSWRAALSHGLMVADAIRSLLVAEFFPLLSVDGRTTKIGRRRPARTFFQTLTLVTDPSRLFLATCCCVVTQ